VAAKNLLHGAPEGFFKVSIFEAQKDLGGLWPTSRDDTERQIHPLMFTNGSKHTVAFSDLCWEDDGISQFPRAYNVGQYLRRYHNRYLGGNSNFELLLNSRVVKSEPSAHGSGPWVVSFESGNETHTKTFDYMIVASGFFGQPITPPCFEQTKTSGIPVSHSCHYRDLKSLLGQGRAGGGKILVVGGQMSGVEIAGTIGTHLSSAINSPDEFGIPDIDRYSIHNVVPRPTWVFPLFTSPEVSTKMKRESCQVQNANNHISQPLRALHSCHWTLDSSIAAIEAKS
jgi:cation diffusion facilitator CzcD-associated flavoprotein CzcO